VRCAHARPPKGAPTPASCWTHDPRNPGRNRRKSGPLPGSFETVEGPSTGKLWRVDVECAGSGQSLLLTGQRYPRGQLLAEPALWIVAHEGVNVECACRCQIGTCGVYARCTELLGFSPEVRNVADSWAQNSDGLRHAFNIRSPSDFRGNCSSRRAAEFSLGPPGVRAGANRTPRRAIETRSARGGMGSRGTQPSDVPT